MDTIAKTYMVSVKILRRVVMPAGALLLPGEFAEIPAELVPSMTAGLDPFAVLADPVVLESPPLADAASTVKAVERSPRDTMQKRPDFHKGVS